MGDETGAGGASQAAPTTTTTSPTTTTDTETTIEAVVTVRPIKVIGMLLSAFALLLMFLSVTATGWVQADRAREGLWDNCTFWKNDSNKMDCERSHGRDWLMACQALCLMAMALTLIGIICVSLGLRGDNFQRKCRLYIAGVIGWFAAVGVLVLALIVYPIKFLNDIKEKEAAQWQFGWSYGLSWTAVLCVTVGAILILVDIRTVEVEEREVTVKKEGFEEEVVDDV